MSARIVTAPRRRPWKPLAAILMTAVLGTGSAGMGEGSEDGGAGPGSGDTTLLRDVRLRREDVFVAPAGEQLHWLFRMANALHVKTKPYVIHTEILVKPGEAVDSLSFAESLRLLRERDLFQRVSGRLERTDSGLVAHVNTQDYWTLNLQTGYSQEGGIRSGFLGIYDSNVLGTGNTLTASQRWSTDRDQTRVAFVAPRILGRRENMALEARETSDGLVRGLFLGHLYDNPLEPWVYGIRAFDFDGQYRLYEKNEEVARLELREEYSVAYVGHFPGERTQVGAGAGIARYDFTPLYLEVLRPAGWDVRRPSSERLRLAFLMVGAQQRRFLQTRNLNRFDVVEDYPLGWSAQLLLGRNMTAWGARDRRYHAQALAQASARILSRWFAAAATWASVEWERDDLGRRRILWRGLLMRRHTPTSLSALQATGRWGADLPPEERVYLGGRFGLRGYPSRELSGTRHLLLNFEHRFWTPLRYAFIGFGLSAFADAAIMAGEGKDLAQARWEPAAGVGLLVGNQKSSSGILRLELARRLDGAGEWDLIVSTTDLMRLVPHVDIAEPILDVFDHRP